MRVQTQLEEKIKAALAPQHIELHNESHKHHVPPGSESHFNAIIVSASFEGQSRVQRQRAVYEAVGELLRTEVHAFTMKTFTPDEWQAAGGSAENASPDCRGGSKAEGRFS